MSKQVTLSISERVAAVKILNDFKGNLDVLAVLLDDIKKLSVTTEEWTKAGLVKTLVKNAQGEETGQENWNWNDTPELEKEIELHSETALYILNEIKRKEEAKEMTLADAPLITLKKKLL